MVVNYINTETGDDEELSLRPRHLVNMQTVLSQFIFLPDGCILHRKTKDSRRKEPLRRNINVPVKSIRR